ncbi:WD40/YVTN/BNR-like repeat-containing protein [Undibacterium sp. Ji50W]|uniref:WD40/YVTN/BNR-like repeat-containing protein n=1 Tax=Undibacterium sp. Ji50W TaxID=3413041 RepID=UPI003BF3C894
MKKIIAIILPLFFVSNLYATAPLVPTEPSFTKLFIGPHGEFLARAGKDIYRSTDSGLHWVKVFANASVLLLIQGTDVLSIKIPGSIYRSKDFGITWKYDGETKNVSWAEQMFHESVAETSIDENGTYYICVGYQTLQISSNGGKSWRQASGLNECSAVAATNQFIYVVGRHGLFKSVDSGLHWTNVPILNIEMKELFSKGYVRFLKIDSGGKLYAVGYESSDGEMSWRRQNFGIAKELEACVVDVRSDIMYITTGGTPDVPFIGYLSINGGLAKKIGLPYTGYDPVTRNGSNLYITTGGNIYKSTNEGVSWSNLGKDGID